MMKNNISWRFYWLLVVVNYFVNVQNARRVQVCAPG